MPERDETAGREPSSNLIRRVLASLGRPATIAEIAASLTYPSNLATREVGNVLARRPELFVRAGEASDGATLWSLADPQAPARPGGAHVAATTAPPPSPRGTEPSAEKKRPWWQRRNDRWDLP